MLRLFGILFVVISFLVFPVSGTPVLKDVVGVEIAHAQAKKKRRSLFDLLFKRLKKNRPSARKQTREATQPRPKTRRASSQASTARSAPAKPKVIIVTKSENAGKILVVGDFMAGGLAEGLTSLYQDNPDYVIVEDTKASSGIVRDDIVNWSEAIGELIKETKPVAIVFLAGMNDRQQMRTSEGRYAKLSDEWRGEYTKRAKAIAQASRINGMPFVWVGLPPVRSGSMNSDYLVFNEIYRNQTLLYGGSFIDVWDGFTDAEGKYVSAGPDIKGRIVRLRTGKGINMTRAGKAKLAFYVDRELRRLGVVNDNSQFLSALRDASEGAGTVNRPEYDPAKTGKTVVISLARPSEGESGLLDGDEGFLEAKDGKNSVSHPLVEMGVLPSPQAGRIDAEWGVSKKPEAKEEEKGDKTSALEINAATVAASLQNENQAARP